MRKCGILLLFLKISFLAALCQTANDQYDYVQALPFDTPVSSATNLNSVQKGCVDEKLTGQCIQYHNDQWFSYLPQSDAPFFINVYGQSCKNDKGVQLVVFTGELCETSSYQVIQCISTATPEDFYFTLERPSPDQIHYMIIDGYLGDFCDFTIEVSGIARGLPALPGDPDGEGEIHLQQNCVELKWRYNPGLEEQWTHFKVIRASSDKKKWSLPFAHNTSGKLLQEYRLLDTLTESGSYKYVVYLVNEKEEHQIHFTQKINWSAPEDAMKTTAYFPFAVPRKTDLQVTIREPFTGRMLINKFVGNYNLSGFEYDFADLVRSGKLFFEIQVQDLKTTRKEIFTKSFAID